MSFLKQETTQSYLCHYNLLEPSSHALMPRQTTRGVDLSCDPSQAVPTALTDCQFHVNVQAQSFFITTSLP